MKRAMLFDGATVTTTEQAVEAAAQKALPSRRLRCEKIAIGLLLSAIGLSFLFEARAAVCAPGRLVAAGFDRPGP